MNYKEVKDQLETFFNIDKEAANNIRSLFEKKIHPDKFESVQKWTQQCYNEPEFPEKFMCALNEVIGGFGVEALRLPGHFNSYYGDAVAEYVNTGDTYSATIVHDFGLLDDSEEGYDFTTWGGWYEDRIDPLVNWHRSREFWEAFSEKQEEKIEYDDTFLVPIEDIMELCPHYDQPVKYFIEDIERSAEDYGVEICYHLYKEENGQIDIRKSWIFIKDRRKLENVS